METLSQEAHNDRRPPNGGGLVIYPRVKVRGGRAVNFESFSWIVTVLLIRVMYVEYCWSCRTISLGSWL